jgi:hypothetical protein
MMAQNVECSGSLILWPARTQEEDFRDRGIHLLAKVLWDRAGPDRGRSLWVGLEGGSCNGGVGSLWGGACRKEGQTCQERWARKRKQAGRGQERGNKHAFNSNTREAEAGGFLSSRPAWSTEFQGYTEKPCLEEKKKKERKEKIDPYKFHSNKHPESPAMEEVNREYYKDIFLPLKKNTYFYFMCMIYMLECMYVCIPHTPLVPAETRRGHGISWHCSLSWV